jgi:hypothetical protein
VRTADPNRNIRERLVEHIHRLGARPVCELLLEIAEQGDCLAKLDQRLEAYASLNPAVVRALGADRFPRRLQAVPNGLRRAS